MDGHSEANDSFHSGIVLRGSHLHSLSIIDDPKGSNRAMLLVAFNSPVAGGDDVIEYSIYQLQGLTIPQRKSDVVFTRLSMSGTTSLACHDTLSVFLAGGSFSFQLGSEQVQDGECML